MKKPRTTFAAPFVLVIGCGQPQEHASTPHRHHHHHHARVAEATADAGVMEEPIDEPLDAAIDAPIDAIWDGVSPAEQCKNPRKYHVYCNPPPPPIEERGTHNPPAPEARIVRTEIQGNKVVVTVPLGTDQGVMKDWRAVVVDEHDVPVRGGDGVLVRVDKRSTVIVVKLTLDQVNLYGRVRLYAP